jgi:hypothetical protein
MPGFPEFSEPARETDGDLMSQMTVLKVSRDRKWSRANRRTAQCACPEPDQYRATMMIAAIINTAISESVRSSIFDRDFVASIGGMA